MTMQPQYHEPNVHFDLYSVRHINGEWHVIQLFKNLSWLSAEMLAGVEHSDFCLSFEYTGWLGTCPEWCSFKPIVTVPRGTSLTVDQAEFILEQTE